MKTAYSIAHLALKYTQRSIYMNKCAVIALNTSRNRNTVQIQIFSTYKIQIICSPTLISSYQRIQVKTQYPALSKTDGHHTISHQASTQTNTPESQDPEINTYLFPSIK